MSSRCPKFTTVEDRAAEIKNQKGYEPCNKCLFQHKQNINCNPCMITGCTSRDTHGTLACPKILDQLNPKTSNNAKAVTVTTNKRNCSVALPTITAQVECSVNEKSLQVVGVLLDTAAQQSLIHRNVVERLGIEPVRQEFTTLVGFGMSRPMAKSYDVVRVKLYKPGYSQKSTITCLVVDRPQAICNMAGVSQLAKKLAKRGADIADSRLLDMKSDILQSEVLVGADYYMSFVCTNKPPTRLLGNYLLNTIFGQALIGKISGSTRLTDSKTVSQLSIVNIATINNEEFSDNSIQDIYSGNDSIPNITAINGRARAEQG